MKVTYPRLEVTHADVLRYAKKCKLPVSENDARRWLRQYEQLGSGWLRRTFDQGWNHGIMDYLTMFSYPNAEFDKFFRMTDEAIHSAAWKRAEQLGREAVGFEVNRDERRRLTVFLMKAGSAGRTALCYERICFCRPDMPDEFLPYRTYPVLVNSKSGKVTASIIKASAVPRLARVRVFWSRIPKMSKPA